MTGPVCFTVCFEFYFRCYALISLLETVSAISLSRTIKTHPHPEKQWRRETSINELNELAGDLSALRAWRAGCDKALPFLWDRQKSFRASGGRALLWTHIVSADHYLSSGETLGYLLWAVVARKERPLRRPGRMCHYQECQQSFWVIVNNICMTARTVFVLQSAPCPAVYFSLVPR